MQGYSGSTRQAQDLKNKNTLPLRIWGCSSASVSYKVSPDPIPVIPAKVGKSIVIAIFYYEYVRRVSHDDTCSLRWNLFDWVKSHN
jgi:hypothetical protein